MGRQFHHIEGLNTLRKKDRRFFMRAVNSELRQKGTEEEVEFLRQPENLDQWLYELSLMLRHIDNQFAEKKTEMEKRHTYLLENGTKSQWLEEKLEYQIWRSRSSKLKISIENKIKEVKRAVQRRDTELEDFAEKLFRFLDDDNNFSPEALEMRDELQPLVARYQMYLEETTEGGD